MLLYWQLRIKRTMHIIKRRRHIYNVFGNFIERKWHGVCTRNGRLAQFNIAHGQWGCSTATLVKRLQQPGENNNNTLHKKITILICTWSLFSSCWPKAWLFIISMFV